MIFSDALPKSRCNKTWIARMSGRSFFTSAAILAALACSLPVHGQTAHFTAALTPVDSSLSVPEAVAVDASGNVYIADAGHHLVVKETLANGMYTQSTITTSASDPQDIALDASGNVYIADDGNQCVWKETYSNGSYTESTIVTGIVTLGVAVDSSNNVYLTNFTTGQLLEETPSGNSYTQSVIPNTSLRHPDRMTADASGNIYIADYGNSRVVKEAISGGSNTESLVASTGATYPGGVAVDSSGNVYITESTSSIYKETLSGGTYTESSYLTTGLDYPGGMAFDANGYLYVADIDHNRVVKVATALTNLGSVNVGSSSGTANIIFTFDTGGAPGGKPVLTQGVTGLDFTDAGTGTCATGTTYNAAATCTVDVIFSPKVSGDLQGGVTLLNSSGAVIATAYLEANGLGPQLVTYPGTKSTILSGLLSADAEAVDGADNLYVLEGSGVVLKETLQSGTTYSQTTVGNVCTGVIYQCLATTLRSTVSGISMWGCT